jgi:hypothetical protein
VIEALVLQNLPAPALEAMPLLMAALLYYFGDDE